ncbi:MAG: hypothetical protein AAF823_04935 [Planctomycetota bacterium]
MPDAARATNQATPPRDPRARRPRGFTLIETLIAGMMLAIFGTAIVMAVAQGARQVQHDRDLVRATQALDEVLHRVSIVGPSNLAIGGPTQGVLGDDLEWSLQIEQQPLSDLYDVTATITWQRRARERSASVATVFHDPLTTAIKPTWAELDPQ